MAVNTSTTTLLQGKLSRTELEVCYDELKPPSMGVDGNTLRSAYEELVRTRKACQLCEHLTNPAFIDCPADSDRIGPYSLWQGNLRTSLVVVGQDFADVDTYKASAGWPGERVGTNL